MASSFPFPGFFIGNIDEAAEFEHWFITLGGQGRYVGQTLVLDSGQKGEVGDLVIEEAGEFRILKKTVR